MSALFRGYRAWLIQRLTAVYMLGFIVFLAIHFGAAPPASYDAWRAWMRDPWIEASGLLFLSSLLVHAWIGMRDVILDYAKPRPVRALLLAIVAFGLAAIWFWTLQVFLSLH